MFFLNVIKNIKQSLKKCSLFLIFNSSPNMKLSQPIWQQLINF